jgi:hypothetical protein
MLTPRPPKPLNKHLELQGNLIQPPQKKAFSNVPWQNNPVPKSSFVMNTHVALVTNFLPKWKEMFTIQQTIHPFITVFTSES